MHINDIDGPKIDEDIYVSKEGTSDELEKSVKPTFGEVYILNFDLHITLFIECY